MKRFLCFCFVLLGNLFWIFAFDLYGFCARLFFRQSLNISCAKQRSIVQLRGGSNLFQTFLSFSKPSRTQKLKKFPRIFVPSGHLHPMRTHHQFLVYLFLIKISSNKINSDEIYFVPRLLMKSRKVSNFPSNLQKFISFSSATNFDSAFLIAFVTQWKKVKILSRLKLTWWLCNELMSCLLEITMRKRWFDDFWCRGEQKKTQIEV